MADVIYGIYQRFEIAYDKALSRVEPAIAITSRPYLETFKGFKVLDANKLEVYVNYWHFDENYIAEYANVAGLSMPWEILYAMDTVVFNERKAAYSDTAAVKFNIPWLSLVMDRDARLVVNTINRLERESTYPENVFAIIAQLLASVNEAHSRYKASIEWFKRYGMLVISNGPFKLVKYDPPAQYAELEAFRDPTYPFKPGHSYYGSANRIEILKVATQPLRIGRETKVRVTLRGPGQPALRYLIFDPSRSEIIETGEAERESPSEFAVIISSDVTSRLKKGIYQLFLVAYSNEISQVSERVEILEAGAELTETEIIERPIEASPLTAFAVVIIGVAVVGILVFCLYKRRGAKRKA
jgi:peptide/nickel transport system substrate-binding protein